MPGRAAVAAGANALSLINTINFNYRRGFSTLEISPNIGGKGGHGGYAGGDQAGCAEHACGPGTDEIISDSHLPIPGWAALPPGGMRLNFLLLGASSVQVCTA